MSANVHRNSPKENCGNCMHASNVNDDRHYVLCALKKCRRRMYDRCNDWDVIDVKLYDQLFSRDNPNDWNP